ncbi:MULTISPECIES: alpha-galactosidase [unclassified Enterococcus]|uniref:alpha-galactosidase n=1 Tax=unclassified Enterococcus TaxID=2608891 RepID=UPI0015528063|nr:MULTISPECIES: alpha-galactosidase [unclassified Enterococcus]MBS7577998.1 alpha-galactosidase [Enterococcus sp. MMGLQ5-2]MBS7585312.1 alpha-galactosidase [Enterococcus sp. MMGLQ5-1]NPD13169.1 alpha-galactosidase [Enterococcus sp. MMGLQ5-1]NPD37829.1 alpha-galactosidase [Enterococcus sp. MMGLQ5-2]
MPIIVENQLFHLQNEEISYVISVEKGKYLVQRYWGRKIETFNDSRKLQMIDRGFATNPYPEERTFSLNSLPLETSTNQNGDHRIANYTIRSASNHTVTDFTFDSYEIFQGKKVIEGLPTLEADEQQVTTLKIKLVDAIQNLEMTLYYHLFETLPVISRHVTFKNRGDDMVILENAGSVQIDIAGTDYDLLTLDGSHTDEATINRSKLRSGIQRIESIRGTSSPQHQPFIALLQPNTDDFSGEVRAFHLIYSGNFQAQAEVEQYGSTRIQLGIHPQEFAWQLKPEMVFETPEAVMVFAKNGLNDMSQTFHQLYQNHLIPEPFRKQARPIVLNTWEANYFDITEEKCEQLATKAAEAGIELFVLDDGWFGKRDDDTTSLGDWYENLEKLPNGISGLAKMVHQKGLQFGLWFEPEMISRSSQLYQKHPDWALSVPNYQAIEGRRQLVLDLSNPDVQAFIIDMLTSYLKNGDIDYIKWDMNRHLTDVGSSAFPSQQQGEIGHRYILGLYQILAKVTQRFPNVLFENCSSGGGRFDPGMMRYMAQNWTSDNTDALCRTKIQTGYSLIYPPIMMAAHVSAVPNHQVGRITSLETRADIAMSGNLGYELDLTACTSEELAEIKAQTSFYRLHRELLQFGKFYRIKPISQYFEAGWLILNEAEAVVIYFNGLARPAVPVNYLPLHYLDNQAIYEEASTGQLFSGSELNYSGITIPRIKTDFKTLVYHFIKQ